MTRIVAISDTHNRLDEVDIPDGDILIHSGDATNAGTVKELVKFRDELTDLKKRFQHIIFVAGNHDLGFEDNPYVSRSLILESGAIYLQDTSVELEGIKFHGSPHQPYYGGWAFNIKSELELYQKFWLIKSDVNVLVTHSPPYSILDSNAHGILCGSTALLTRVEEVKPRFHIFGHIHENAGKTVIGPTTFINASICDKSYQPLNKPQIFDYDS